MSNASVSGRIVVTGELQLDSPLLIGDGMGENSDNTRDIHVLKDQNGKPFIPGTSLCGVLREYVEGTSPTMINQLFGFVKGNKSRQSAIAIDDIELDDGELTFRDGVRIDSATGTGVEGGKYDYEAVERGAHGWLRMSVTVRELHDRNAITDAVARLIRKLELGIRLGAMTSKGFGRVHVENIAAGLYDFRNRSDVAAWLEQIDPVPARASTPIVPSSDVHIESDDDLIVDAHFALSSSFIVRDYNRREQGEDKINAFSLKSRDDFVVPGTSLKGVLRHRAEYILNRLGVDVGVLDELMGMSTKTEKLKSRFIVAESYVSARSVTAVAQTRTRIDRFTGGVLQGGLFTTEPVWQSSDEPTLNIHFEIHDVKREAEVGLALALLRDLWLGRLALGGEKSIGRGTLSGRSARIEYKGRAYELDRDGKVVDGDVEEFARPTRSLKNYLREAN